MVVVCMWKCIGKCDYGSLKHNDRGDSLDSAQVLSSLPGFKETNQPHNGAISSSVSRPGIKCYISGIMVHTVSHHCIANESPLSKPLSIPMANSDFCCPGKYSISETVTWRLCPCLPPQRQKLRNGSALGSEHDRDTESM